MQVTSDVIIAVAGSLLTIALCVIAAVVVRSLYVARRKRFHDRNTQGPRLHQIHVAGYKYPGRATCIRIILDTYRSDNFVADTGYMYRPLHIISCIGDKIIVTATYPLVSATTASRTLLFNRF